jgi:integrase
MARKVKDKELDSREARGKLKPRGKPYWRAIDPGLHIGYRKPRNGAGKWVVRLYAGDQAYVVETIATADDLSDATFHDRDIPGVQVKSTDVLSFYQAQTKARALRDGRSRSEAGITGPLTVSDAMDAYIEYLEKNPRTAADARSRDKLFIRPSFGDVEIDKLDADQLRRWHSANGKAPRYSRAPDGKTRRLAINGDDGARARCVSANRTLMVLKAALNRVWRAGKVTGSDRAWRSVQPFKGVDKARIRYLTVTEAARLTNACDPEFRPMVQAALQTGCRYGELTRLQVHDFNPDSGTLAVRQSKSGKPRHVVLTDEGIALFRELCAGRSGNEILIRRADCSGFGQQYQQRPMKAAVARAKISPPITFHSLRHTWASLAVMNGVPPMVVAKNLGHRDTRMVEKHYGHLAPSYIADAIRACAPRFGFEPDKKIVELLPVVR